MCAARGVWQGQWRPLSTRAWVPLTSEKVMREQPFCFLCLRSALRYLDSYHFFSRLLPWGGECGTCVLAGGHCHVESNLRLLGRAGRCPALYAMQEAFWGQFELLVPTTIAESCMPRLSAPTTERVCYERMRVGNSTSNLTYCPASTPFNDSHAGPFTKLNLTRAAATTPARRV